MVSIDPRISRRTVLAAAAFAPIVLGAQPLGVDAGFWSRPRQVWIRRQQSSEEIRVVYFADGQVQWHGYAQVCTVLRDLQASKAAQIDLRLLDALCGAQGYLAAHGIQVPWVASSGYRTARTNGMTEGAARNSQHLRGCATDGHFPGVSLKHQAALSRLYLQGGLGWYPSRGFIHLDTGAQRVWRG